MPETGRGAPDPTSVSGAVARPATGRAILVVDDEPGVRAYVADVLRRNGHEVLTAAGGREALRAIYGSSSTPALLVSDIDMPTMSGVELAARLHADRPGIRVILMTGTPASAEAARSHPELVSEVLLKPFALDELLGAVERTLDRPANG